MGISKKTFTIIAILAMADVLVMAVPFYLKNVISSVVISESLGILPSQFSQANSIYGYVSLPSYFIGGWLADKISLKKLTLVGLASIGVVGLWYGFIPFIATAKVIQIYLIFALWSFITCFIFWAALWKLLSEQGKPEENGKLNGIHGSLNGLIGTVIIAIAYLVFFLFGTVWKSSLGDWAFPALVFIFTGFIIANCFLIFFFVPEDKTTKKDGESDFSLKSFKNILFNWKIWLVSILILGVYLYQSGLSIFVTYMQDVLLITASLVVVFGILRTYLFRFFFSTYFGKMADKSQKYILFIIIGLAVASVLCLIAVIVPGFSENSFTNMSKGSKTLVQVSVVTMYLGLGITCWALVTNRWATIYVINISQKEYGMAVGFISLIAFSADAWFWQIDSILLKNLGSEAGYVDNKLANQISIIIILCFGLLAMIAGGILIYATKKEAHKNLSKQVLTN
ncbi:MFS transporter [Mesoplasma entomophilum]|uniref:MFS transporter n=1 Tax=Mesoplasma entomophilum TaxID=2149 RepID=UPI001F12B3BF|nr:MFS transporter [Mesoplasma entomophilum]